MIKVSEDEVVNGYGSERKQETKEKKKERKGG